MPRLCFPEINDFHPKPEIKYTFVLNTGEKINLFFTETEISRDEMFMGHDAYECWDEQDERYVCHISECCCSTDEMVIALMPDSLLPKSGNKMLSVKEIYIHETELIYCLE